MTDHPIIFSAPMILALLADRKTQTRRLAYRPCNVCGAPGTCEHERRTSPWRNVKVSDRLYVRENLTRSGGYVRYAADRKVKHLRWSSIWKQDPRPSIHMPRSLSRLTLILTGTKVERLQDISEIDAVAEGIEQTTYWREDHPPSICFSVLWDAIHADIAAWRHNPEVVALTFRVVQANIDSPEAREAV